MIIKKRERERIKFAWCLTKPILQKSFDIYRSDSQVIKTILLKKKAPNTALNKTQLETWCNQLVVHLAIKKYAIL